MYHLNPRLAAEVFDGEYIIANLDTGLYYSVQGIAVSLLNLLPYENPQNVITQLSEVFPEHSTTILAELNAILKDLLENEIILNGEMRNPAETPAFVPPGEYIPARFNQYADMKDLLLLDPIHDVDEEGWTVQN